MEDLADFVLRFDPLQPARDEAGLASFLTGACLFCSIHHDGNKARTPNLKNVRSLPRKSNGYRLEFLVSRVSRFQKKVTSAQATATRYASFFLSLSLRIQIDISAHAAFQFFQAFKAVQRGKAFTLRV